jgi:hypothetical protein
MCLTVKRRDEHNSRYFPTPHNRDHKHNSAVRVVYIAGRPAMSLCKGCSDKFKAMWAEADRGYREWEAAA